MCGSLFFPLQDAVDGDDGVAASPSVVACVPSLHYLPDLVEDVGVCSLAGFYFAAVVVCHGCIPQARERYINYPLQHTVVREVLFEADCLCPPRLFLLEPV